MPPVPLFSSSTPPADSAAVQIDIADGDGKTFSQLSRLLPGSRGKPCSPSTLWRWATEGIALPGGGRSYLEVARLGCRWYSSRAALLRFMAQQNQHAGTPAPAEASAQREKQVADAERQLRAAGV
jgi:hypothetical protein